MSKFYTNIQLAGDTVLYRGYEDGQAVQFRTQFSPTLLPNVIVSTDTANESVEIPAIEKLTV